MFTKPKPVPFVLPKGAKETFAVRYSGGRKTFDTKTEATDFAQVQRSNKDGWAEVSQVIEIVVSPR